MSENKPQFNHSTVDWREALRKNNQKTRWVIASFLLIYLSIGFLFDLYLQSMHYRDASSGQIVQAFLQGQLTPYATFISVALAVISIVITFKLHDKIMLAGTNYVEITEENASAHNATVLFNVLKEMQIAAGLTYTPKLFIINAEYLNAFASGYSEQSAMIAVSRGLLEALDRDELTAVVAHELSHIRHGDIKLTLVASVLTNLSLMLVDILFYNALFSPRDNSEQGRNKNQWLWIIMLIRFVLPLITSLLMLYLSRTREYMADAGSVELMRSAEPMGRALVKIQQYHQTQTQNPYTHCAHESVRKAAYIVDPEENDWLSTHPSIFKRLRALGLKRQAH